LLIPFAVPLTVILGGAAIWSFFERRATGDRSCRHVNDLPRNAPVRTAAGVAAMTFYGVLWIEGANDVIADELQVRCTQSPGSHGSWEVLLADRPGRYASS
jgi:ubiquinol-cytochrome c reductase cytochrome b subunit